MKKPIKARINMQSFVLVVFTAVAFSPVVAYAGEMEDRMFYKRKAVFRHDNFLKRIF